MRWKSVLLAIPAGFALSLIVVALSHVGRAQAGKIGDAASQGRALPVTRGGLPNFTPEQMRAISVSLNKMTEGVKWVKQGDKAVAREDWRGAKADYEQAYAVFPTYTEALYGLGQCAANAGDLTKAIGYYRTVVYSHDPNRYGLVRGDGYATNNPERLMEFVLILSQAGQSKEALSVYKRAAYLLNYEDGRQNIPVLLPDFSSDGTAYTPQRMQAMAHVGVAYSKEDFDDAAALRHLQQAAALAPNLPQPYFYRARYWADHSWRHRKEDAENARADYAKAAKLGQGDVRAAAEKALQ